MIRLLTIPLLFGLAGCGSPGPSPLANPLIPTRRPTAPSLPKFASKATLERPWVQIGWTPAPNAIGSKVYMRGTLAGPWTNIFDVGPTNTFAIGGLVRGNTYYFAVSDYKDLESSLTGDLPVAAPLFATNLITITVTVQSSTNAVGWSNVVTLPALAFTNPTEPAMFYRALMAITSTNL